ncbi:hypothetical protein [Patiriisocius marinus]|uniref:Glycosyltransferase n=1 Tax=Patiriisocius marinus TaxID=1397112 RepID=A0A5J4J0Y2_9FLAO|nr:hypothetical protein [Patiriisocius marinus]GER59471.1 hypothetical protein ULMA_15790 [Patiriisocius marinus]
MICFYVQGGGLGHLARVEKVIRHLNIDEDNVVIITPSSFSKHFPQFEFVQLRWNDSVEIWQKQISDTFHNYLITACYVDVFPFGIKAELPSIYEAFENISFHYIARILKWEFYKSECISAINFHFKSTLVLERLYETHKIWIQRISEEIIYIDIAPQTMPKQIRLHEKPYSLVIHSGGIKAVEKLCDLAIGNTAEKPNELIAVITQVPFKHVNPRIITHTGLFGILPYLHFAEHIYTAAGFNTVNELKNYRAKHTIFPFDKLYDDQFLRVKQVL